MHDLTAIIGAPEVVQTVVRGAECPNLTLLPQGFAIAPLGYSQIDALTNLKPGYYVENFNYLSDGLKGGIFSLIGNACLAYVETEYFGGTGSQGAAFFGAGEISFERATSVDRMPADNSSPINTALRHLGVQVAIGDEFEALGLHRFRNNEALGLRDDNG